MYDPIQEYVWTNVRSLLAIKFGPVLGDFLLFDRQCLLI